MHIKYIWIVEFNITTLLLLWYRDIVLAARNRVIPSNQTAKMFFHTRHPVFLLKFRES